MELHLRYAHNAKQAEQERFYAKRQVADVYNSGAGSAEWREWAERYVSAPFQVDKTSLIYQAMLNNRSRARRGLEPLWATDEVDRATTRAYRARWDGADRPPLWETYR